MQARQPRLRRVDVDGVGHAPTLAEPIAVAALDAFYLAGSTSLAAGRLTRKTAAGAARRTR